MKRLVLLPVPPVVLPLRHLLRVMLLEHDVAVLRIHSLVLVMVFSVLPLSLTSVIRALLRPACLVTGQSILYNEIEEKKSVKQTKKIIRKNKRVRAVALQLNDRHEPVARRTLPYRKEKVIKPVKQ